MKDAFGGAFMLKIMIIFFVIFISFMTVAINFAKTFRIKNNVINIIERNDVTSVEIQDKILDYLRSASYVYSNNPQIKEHCDSIMAKSELAKDSSFPLKGDIGGVCVVPFGSRDSYYYWVSSYMVVNSPMFSLGFAIPIVGESKILVSQKGERL